MQDQWKVPDVWGFKIHLKWQEMAFTNLHTQGLWASRTTEDGGLEGTILKSCSQWFYTSAKA